MKTIRPADATHWNDFGMYYKADPIEGLNWMRWDGRDTLWLPVGSIAAGTLTPLPPVQVAELEKFDDLAAPQSTSTACAEAACGRQRLIGSKFCILHGAVPAPQATGASEAEKWPCAPVAVVVPFTSYFAQYRFVGSRITCNPPPLDTDQDVLVHVHATNMAVLQNKLQAAGFVREGSNPADMNANVDNQSVFHSFRKGDMNYIITSELEFYERFSTATELARKWNLLEKADRIQLFQAVLYGKWWA